MPTKHIDEATAAQLDDLYVRCVTLTQQPVKEVEVLRLATHTGIDNITDNQILASITVKDSVWQRLAEQTWGELTARWPEEAITTVSFESLAGKYSDTWLQLTDGRCRTALRDRLASRLLEPDRLFARTEGDAGDEDMRAAAERDTVREVEYRAELPTLHGRPYNTLSPREKALANLYISDSSDSCGVSFTPDGQGDFTVVVREPAEAAVGGDDSQTEDDQRLKPERENMTEYQR